MKLSKFTGEEIAIGLRQAEVVRPVAEVCRKMDVSYNVIPLEAGVRRPGHSELRKMR